MNIREALLHDPENGKLHLFGQTRKDSRDVEPGVDFAAFGKSLDIPMKRGCETGFIQQGRMQ